MSRLQRGAFACCVSASTYALPYREELPTIYKCPYQGCTAVYRGADGMKVSVLEAPGIPVEPCAGFPKAPRMLVDVESAPCLNKEPVV